MFVNWPRMKPTQRKERTRYANKKTLDDMIWMPGYCYARNHFLFSYISTNTPSFSLNSAEACFHLGKWWPLLIHTAICILNINFLQYWTHTFQNNSCHFTFPWLEPSPLTKTFSHSFSALLSIFQYFTSK